MADEVVFVLHRAVVVKRGAEKKGDGYPNNPVGFKDSPFSFTVTRELDEKEEQESRIKRLAEFDRQVTHLFQQAAIARRVEELRRQQRG